MKNIKLLFVPILGLLVAIVVYPFLHEAGHSVFSVILGAEIKEFNLFPLPNVLCNISGLSIPAIVSIGLGGLIVPYLLSMSFTPKGFWLWYANLIVRLISLYAISLSIANAMIYRNGTADVREDIIQVLNHFEEGTWLFIIAFLLMFIYGVVRIIRDKPLKKICDYFA